MVETSVNTNSAPGGSFLRVYWQCRVVEAPQAVFVCMYVCKGISHSQPAKTSFRDLLFVYYAVEMELRSSGTDTDQLSLFTLIQTRTRTHTQTRLVTAFINFNILQMNHTDSGRSGHVGIGKFTRLSPLLREFF